MKPLTPSIPKRSALRRLEFSGIATELLCPAAPVPGAAAELPRSRPSAEVSGLPAEPLGLSEVSFTGCADLGLDKGPSQDIRPPGSSCAGATPICPSIGTNVCFSSHFSPYGRGMAPESPSPPSAPAPRSPRRALGTLGEDFAVGHFRRLDFVIVERNVRTRHGEIDLIAFDGRTLVFAEVKTRRASNRRRGLCPEEQPLAWLKFSQRSRLKRLACACSVREHRRTPQSAHDPLRRSRRDRLRLRPAAAPRSHRGGLVRQPMFA